MTDTGELAGIAQKLNQILIEELGKANISPELAEARIFDVKTVGVQGDERTYAYPAEITLYSSGSFVWEPDFLARLSSAITNKIKDVNRVVYVTGKRD